MPTTREALPIILCAASCSTLAQQASPSVAAYQMDLFSIISFALAIAAFVVSIFMGWLSWEFYKKSTEASEKSQQAVTKIETAVLSIQSEITEIVRRAVGYWTGGATDQDVAETAALAQKVEDLSTQIASVSGNAANKQELDAKLAELVRLQRDQIATLMASVTEAKARAIFPSIADRGPVADVTHTVTASSESDLTGRMVLLVHRPSRVVTATTKFEGQFTTPAALKVALIDAPSGKLDQVRLNSGIGSSGHFNVHLHPIGGSGSGLVEPGTYVVEYTASATPAPGA